ncbi:universal stress protein [Dactylosporangium sp. CA-139114]|uniref:universal stress protein n=1 Tax=Dactylosporangium sp. CA-139114 TaxID=3239931 RepID=UPI003D960E84
MTGADRPVLAGVDSTTGSLGAARWAADEAVRWHRPLEVIHVGQIPDAAPAERAEVEIRRWQPSLRVSAHTLRGAPADRLIERSAHASLIVVGGQDALGLHAPPSDSVGDRLAAGAHCPVLVVHEAARWAGPAPLPDDRPVLVGMDGSDQDGPALDLGFAEAAARGVTLVAVRVGRAPGHHTGPAGDATRAVRLELEPWEARYRAVRVEARAVDGPPAPMLVEAAGGAAMVVLGPSGRGEPGDRRLGSVTRQVLDHAPAAVLVAGG